jgi:hypothetical protein
MAQVCISPFPLPPTKEDKYDLLEQTEQEIIRHVKDLVQRADSVNPASFVNADEALPMAVALFEYLHDHAAFMRAILGLRRSIAFEAQIKKAIGVNLFKVGFFSIGKRRVLLYPVGTFRRVSSPLIGE